MASKCVLNSPVRNLWPQLTVLTLHLQVIIGENDLLTSRPTGTQRGSVLHTQHMHIKFTDNVCLQEML